MSKPTTIDDFSFLSDEDVKLLYDIITTAEASSARPFKALFAAYDQVLAKYGIAKDHDQIYFRFLLHMGEGRREGEGLFQRFESLLEKLGLQIAFVEDGEEKSNDGEEQDDRGAVGQLRSESNTEDIQKSTRRASFDSAYDTNAESRRVSGIGSAPLLQRPHSTDVIGNGSVKQSESNHEPVGHSKNHRYTQQANGSIKATIRGRLKSREYSRPSKEKSFRQITVSRSRERLYPQNEYGLGSSKSSSPKSDSIRSGDTDGETASNSDANINVQLELFPKPRPAEPDLHEMETHAKTLRYHHLAANAVLIFRNWKNRAFQSLNDHEKLLEVAMSQDAETLKRQAFDQWRSTFFQKRNIKETEKFFENLEVKATKARDLFLLTKAFTHWAQSTSDEVSRKTAARRHILQTRYFNAWRDITVVNELKIRRQGLHKFMSIWKRRTANVIQDHETAAFFCDRKSVDGAYKHWFWHFCERRAPIWYASKLKSNYFSRWIQSTRQNRIQATWAVDAHPTELLRSTIHVWTQRSGMIKHEQNEADVFRRRKLSQVCLEAMRRKLIYAPLQAQTARAIDFRVTRSALTIWYSRLRILYESGRISDARTKRNAWTLWNDRLRCQALSHKIDDRLVLRSLYKWVLQERLVLYLRMRQTKLKRSFFSQWRDKMDELCASLGHAKYQTRQSRERKICMAIMSKWVVSTRAIRQRGTVAEDFLKSHLLNQTTNIWSSKMHHVKRLQDWSKDAQFYVLATSIIKRWQTASIVNKRTKRREAFSKLRRENRMTLARKCFEGWCNATSTIITLQRKAAALNQELVMRKGTMILNTWHTRTILLEQFQPQAEALHTEHSTRFHFTLLLTRYFDIQALTLRADSFLADSTDSAAAGCLRKLNWHIFQLKRQAETAESLADRNLRKHHRSIIRYWADLAKQRRQPTERVLFQPSSSTYPTPIAATYQQPPKNPENLYPPTSGAQIPATPGYLRTPSRHRTSTAITATTSTTTNKTSRFRPSTSSFSRQPRDAHTVTTPATTQFTPFLTRLREVQGPRQGGFYSAARAPPPAAARSRFQRGAAEGAFGRSYLEVVRGTPGEGDGGVDGEVGEVEFEAGSEVDVEVEVERGDGEGEGTNVPGTPLGD